MTGSQVSVRVAIIQATPVYLDLEASIEKARRLVAQAASKGASLVAFGECWLPGYPVHAFAGMETPGWWDLARDYLDKAIEIPGPETELLCQIADEHAVDIVMGVAERDPVTRGSVYSTQLIISAEGMVIGRHRKMRPAIHERAVFADGDASGLQVHERGYAYISGLMGVEHQMVLPTYALAEQGTQFHVGSWPGGEEEAPPAPAVQWQRQHLLSRAFAAQAGAYVLCAGGILSPDDLPEAYRPFLRNPLTGDSVVIDPRGEICAGPVQGETILYANCSPALIQAARIAFDCAGHSSRADQLEFRNHAAQEGDGDMESPGEMGPPMEGYDDPDWDPSAEPGKPPSRFAGNLPPDRPRSGRA